MRTLNKFVSVIALSFLSLAGSAEASIIYSLNQTFDSSGVTGSVSPYGTAVFQQSGADVTLTLSNTALPASQYIAAWSFNYSGASPISITKTSGVNPIYISQAQAGIGFSGNYDFQIGFASSFFDTPPFGTGQAFSNGLTSVYKISGTGITESMFAGLSDGASGTPINTYNTAARILNGGFSGSTIYLANTPAVATPEPATYLSLASLLILGAGVARRKMRAHSTIRG